MDQFRFNQNQVFPKLDYRYSCCSFWRIAASNALVRGGAGFALKSAVLHDELSRLLLVLILPNASLRLFFGGFVLLRLSPTRSTLPWCWALLLLVSLQNENGFTWAKRRRLLCSRTLSLLQIFKYHIVINKSYEQFSERSFDLHCLMILIEFDTVSGFSTW